jgi:drug/metabolite transporter (DMT)-like permease
MQDGTDARTWTAFAGAVLLGGSNFVAVSFSNRELPPFAGATARFAIAAFLFGVLGRLARQPWLRSRRAVAAGLYGLLGFGVAYACLYTALLKLSAGTAAVILASVPILTLLIAVLVGQEKLTARGLIGGALAIAGIAVLSGGKLGGEIPLGSLLAALGAAVSSAWATVIAKGMPDVHPLNLNAYGMAAGTLLLLACSLIAGETWVMPQQGSTIVAFAWLATIGSIGLFQCFLYVVRRWTASAAVYALTAMPVVAAGLGALLLDQPITLKLLFGGALIVFAVWVGALKADSKRKD